MQRFFAVLTALLPLFFIANTASAFSVPSHTLKQGDSGADVVLLQTLLNLSPDTQVAASGSGSPGHESNYFGSKTVDAVKRFQIKYTEEILVPAGLTTPTGFVGALTLKKMLDVTSTQNTVAAIATTTIKKSTPVAYPPTMSAQGNIATLQQLYLTKEDLANTSIVPLSPDMQVAPGTNTNMLNHDYVVSQIRIAGKRNGLTEDQIAKSIQALDTVLATTTDLRKEFFSRIALKTARRSNAEVLSTKIGSTIESFLAAIGLGVPKAQASLGVPFGGLITAAYPCTCTAGTVWQTVIAPPLPPSYATILDAVPEAQIFLSHNIPLVGIETLGFYEPEVGTCWMGAPPYCWPMPEWGIITPFVGSSPL